MSNFTDFPSSAPRGDPIRDANSVVDMIPATLNVSSVSYLSHRDIESAVFSRCHVNGSSNFKMTIASTSR